MKTSVRFDRGDLTRTEPGSRPCCAAWQASNQRAQSYAMGHYQGVSAIFHNAPRCSLPCRSATTLPRRCGSAELAESSLVNALKRCLQSSKSVSSHVAARTKCPVANASVRVWREQLPRFLICCCSTSRSSRLMWRLGVRCERASCSTSLRPDQAVFSPHTTTLMSKRWEQSESNWPESGNST